MIDPWRVARAVQMGHNTIEDLLVMREGPDKPPLPRELVLTSIAYAIGKGYVMKKEDGTLVALRTVP